jgi:hypothetical protein
MTGPDVFFDRTGIGRGEPFIGMRPDLLPPYQISRGTNRNKLNGPRAARNLARLAPRKMDVIARIRVGAKEISAALTDEVSSLQQGGEQQRCECQLAACAQQTEHGF